MKRITRHLLSGMATAGLTLSASSLGLPITTQHLSSAPTLDATPSRIAPEDVNALSWVPGKNVAPGWDRQAIDPVATMETISNTWDTESPTDQTGFSTLGVTTPGSGLTTAQGLNPAERLSLRPKVGEALFSPLRGPASLSEPTTFTLLALGLACLAIRDSLMRKRPRAATSTPAPMDGVQEAPAPHVSQGALICVPPRESRPFDCSPLARSARPRRRRRA